VFEKILSHGALLLVFLSLIAISVFGAITRLLQSLQPQDISFDEIDNTAVKSRPIDIGSIPQDELKKLKRLLERQDALQVAIFCATYRCDVADIAKINDALKNPINPFIKYVDMLPQETIDSFYLSDEYRSISPEHKSAIELLQKSPLRIIDKTFIQQFGGIVFMENFIIYQHMCLADSAFFRIPNNSELRRMFDNFAKHGLAKTGNDIPVADRIRGLDWSDLQMLAGKLGLNRFLHDKEDAILQLAQKPRIDEILDRDFPAGDNFILVKKQWHSDQIELEWKAYLALAEILLKSQQNANKGDEQNALQTMKTGNEVAM